MQTLMMMATLVVGPGEPVKDLGKAKVDLVQCPKWVVTRGWWGGTPVSEGEVVFRSDGIAEVRCRARRESGSSRGLIDEFPYRLDPVTGLPVLRSPPYVGVGAWLHSITPGQEVGELRRGRLGLFLPPGVGEEHSRTAFITGIGGPVWLLLKPAE